MFEMFGRTMTMRAATRATMLAGAAAVALGGLTASARAMPVAMPAPAVIGVEAVQYDGGGYPHHGHHRMHHGRHGINAHPGHPGYAGLYDCGPGGKSTRLSRKNCGGNNRFQHLQQGY